MFIHNVQIVNGKKKKKQNQTNKILNDFFFFGSNGPANSSSPWQPPTDVYETNEEIVVVMSIPGAKAENINVSFSDEMLSVNGFRTDDMPHEKICFYQVEIRYGYFERNVYIPKTINIDHIHATYKNGFLQIILPKAEQKTPKMFTIKINF